MILIVGFIGLIQICYLPGALLRRCFAGQDLDGLERAAYTFALSLIANTWLVTALVLLGLFTRATMWTVIGAETAALAWLAVRDGRLRRGVTIDLGRVAAFLSLRTTNVAIGSILTLTSATLLAYVCYLNWGTVFNGNDDVANWNQWAIEWSRGSLPTRTSYYPQLMPANWSISYVLLGRTDIQMFAKATTTLYPLFTLGLFVSLALRRSQPAFLFGAALFVWLLLHYLGPGFMTFGYADIPVAFFGFLTFYAVYRHAGGPVPADAVAASLLMASGTVITKQGGVYAVAAAGLYAAWHTWSRRRSTIPRASRPALALAAAGIGFAAAWFGWKFWQVQTNLDYSNINVLTNLLHHGRTYGERLMAAWDLFVHSRGEAGPAVAFPMAALVAGSVLLRSTRWITLALLLPFLIAWGWWFSYEIRNAAMAVALCAMVTGITLERVTALVAAPLDRLTIGRGPAGPVLAVAALLVVSAWVLLGRPGAEAVLPGWALAYSLHAWVEVVLWWYSLPTAAFSLLALVWIASGGRGGGRWRLSWSVPVWIPAAVALGIAIVAASGPYADQRIAARQHDLRRQIGRPAVNQRLYAAVRQRAIQEPILTDYWFLRGLPELEHLYRPSTCGTSCSVELLRVIANRQPDVGYVLLHETSFTRETLTRLEGSQEFETVFVESGIRLLYINRARLQPGDHAQVPLHASVVPTAASMAELRLVLRHPDGAARIVSATVIINTRLDRRRACYFKWYRATNTVTLANDSGAGWVGESRLGAEGPIRNSQCAMEAASAMDVEAGRTVELTFGLRALSRFRGPQDVYAAAFDEHGRTLGFRRLATWMAQ